MVSVQNAYNLLNRTYEFGLAELCHRERISLLAYSPLAFGHLSAKYLTDADAKAVSICSRISASATKPNVGEAAQAMRRLPGRAVCRPRRWRWPSCIDAGSWQHHHRRNQHGPTRRGPGAWDWRPEPAVLEEIERIHLRFPNPAP